MVETSSLVALVRSTPADGLIVCLTLGVTVALDEDDHSDEERALLAEHVVAYRIDGPLFFAAVHRLLLELPDLVEVDVVILRMSRVTSLDATGAHVLGDTITRLIGVEGPLRASGHILPDTPEAISVARQLVADAHPSVKEGHADALT